MLQAPVQVTKHQAMQQAPVQVTEHHQFGTVEELQNLTSGNQEILTYNTSLSGGNTSLGQGMEQEQYVEPENQSNALASANSTQ